MRVFEIKGHLTIGFGKSNRTAIAVSVTYFRKEIEFRVNLFTVGMFLAIHWNKRYGKSAILVEVCEDWNTVLIQ